MGSMSMILKQRVDKAMGTRAHMKIFGMMRTSAYALVHEFTNTRNFKDVTGNLLNSFAVGLYYKGKLVEIVDARSINRKPPTRKTLAKGEKYDKASYYDGTPARRETGGQDGRKAYKKPYTGEYGPGGQDGRMAARRSLAQRHPKTRYALIGVVAVKYAAFVERKKGHDVLTGLRDELPTIFEGKIELMNYLVSR